MGRKHNTKHDRISGGYKRRLEARGLAKSPRMATLDELRKWQRTPEQRLLAEIFEGGA